MSKAVTHGTLKLKPYQNQRKSKKVKKINTNTCPRCGQTVTTKQMPLLELNNGQKFTYGGQVWLLLESDEDGGTLAITAEILEARTFDADSNDWRRSEIRHHLNGHDNATKHGDSFLAQLLKGGGELNDFLPIISDLTADNGETDYGTSEDYIALLTCDMFREYRELLMSLEGDDWYWTLTPLNCTTFSHGVRIANGDVLGASNTWHDNIGLRPLCRLKSEIFVSA